MTQQIEILQVNQGSQDTMEEYQSETEEGKKGGEREKTGNESFSCLSVPMVMRKVIKHLTRLAQQSKQDQLIGQRHWHFISCHSFDSEQ